MASSMRLRKQILSFHQTSTFTIHHGYSPTDHRRFSGQEREMRKMMIPDREEPVFALLYENTLTEGKIVVMYDNGEYWSPVCSCGCTALPQEYFPTIPRDVINRFVYEGNLSKLPSWLKELKEVDGHRGFGILSQGAFEKIPEDPFPYLSSQG